MFLFAIKTLFAERGKLVIALLGVVFSLVLVNVQGGLFLGMIRKSSVLVENCRADIWVGHRGVRCPEYPYDIPVSWADRIRGLPGVRAAEPSILAPGQLTLPNGDYMEVFIIGCDPPSMVCLPESFSQGSAEDLLRPDAISLDEQDSWRFGHIELGDIVEISGRKCRCVAMTNGVLGFTTTPYSFTGLDFARECSRKHPNYCSFLLIQAEEGTHLGQLCQLIRRRLPHVDVYTADDFAFHTRVYWTVRTGVGISFGGSTLLGLLVGLAMVAQSLYAFVVEHLVDYATLKAIGAEDSHVQTVLMVQGMVIAAIGTTIGLLLSFVLRAFFSTPLVTIDMPLWLVLTSVVLVVLICFVSTLLPFHRIRHVDPVVVLQG